jgi:hypothetical protein
MKSRPAKGQYVRDSSNRRWKVLVVSDEGVFAERGRTIRFINWHLWEKYWRLDESK